MTRVGHIETTVHGSGPTAFVIAPGTGIRCRFYRHLAAWLAEQGHAAWTLDYRGIGGSRSSDLRGLRVSMADWARQDLAEVIREARRGSDRVVLIGHSFGGQALALLPADAVPDAAVLVNAQSGWWGHWQGSRRAFMWSLWHVLMPGLTRAFGHFPGKRVSSMEDLPPRVARQWSRWGRHRDYIRRDVPSAGQGVRCPVLAFSFSDDPLAPKAAVDDLASWFVDASVERRHVTPAASGRPMGHYGFFRPASSNDLWPGVLAWLDTALRPVAVAPG